MPAQTSVFNISPLRNCGPQKSFSMFLTSDLDLRQITLSCVIGKCLVMPDKNFYCICIRKLCPMQRVIFNLFFTFHARDTARSPSSFSLSTHSNCLASKTGEESERNIACSLFQIHQRDSHECDSIGRFFSLQVESGA